MSVRIQDSGLGIEYQGWIWDIIQDSGLGLGYQERISDMIQDSGLGLGYQEWICDMVSGFGLSHSGFRAVSRIWTPPFQDSGINPCK